jgi:hypothetical protein
LGCSGRQSDTQTASGRARDAGVLLRIR